MEEYSSEDDREHRFEEKEVVKVEEDPKEEEDDEGNKRDWAGLPIELLSLMLTHLHLPQSRFYFHKVCKYWDSIEDPKYFQKKKKIEDPKQHCSLLFPIQVQAQLSQWLVHKDTYGSHCKLFHPLYPDRYTIDIPELASALLLHSNNGWLLFSCDKETVFFINPFTKERVDLPEPPYSVGELKSATFVSDPTSPDCKVFGVVSFGDVRVHFFTIRPGENSWGLHVFDAFSPPMYQSECHPVFHNQKLYCLGKHGWMGVFELDEDNQSKWSVHEVLCSPLKDKTFESYLVECEGELMAVFLSYMGRKISVVRLDEERMEWRKVESLGDFMLFISVATSFARKKTVDGMENKVYLPRLFGDYTVFYCLATETYKTLGNNFSKKDLFETRELLNCCWTEPSARPSTSPQQLNWFPQQA